MKKLIKFIFKKKKKLKCETCAGHGFLYKVVICDDLRTMSDVEKIDCPICKGEGKI